MEWTCYYESPLGIIRIIGAGYSLVRLDFEAPDVKSGNYETAPCASVREWLRAFFAGKNPDPCELELAPAGSPFCIAVWQEIAKIRYGEVMTYKDIACALGTSPRAVGLASGKNPLALVIPCHRVIGADGKLTGYAGGLWRKAWLLRHENTKFLLCPHDKGMGI